METTKKAAWAKAGLPGAPVLAGSGRAVENIELLVRDGKGKAILCEKTNPEPLRNALMLRFVKRVETVRFVTESGSSPNHGLRGHIRRRPVHHRTH